MRMSAQDAAAQLGRECGEECLVTANRGLLVVSAPDLKTAKDIQARVGGEYEGYTAKDIQARVGGEYEGYAVKVLARERVKSGIPRVVATVVEPPGRLDGQP